MSRDKSNITLDVLTLGILRYLRDEGETTTFYDLIDTLVYAYAENYAEENDLDFKELQKDAIRLYERSRRPKTKKGKREQKESAKKAVAKVGSRKRSHSSSFDVESAMEKMREQEQEQPLSDTWFNKGD